MNTKRTQGGAAAKEAKWLRYGAVAALGLALLSGCGPTEQTLTIGDQASHYNREMWELSIWAIAFSVIIFIGVSAVLFYTVFRFREDKHDAPPTQSHGNNTLEAVLVGFPVVIVLLLSVLSVRTMAETTPVTDDLELRGPNINVLAKQFWWNFTYADEKAAAGGTVTNGNEMVMPTGLNTVLTLESGDVVHEFWAPNIGPQRQAIPGSEKVWPVHTDRAAIYQGNCNYLCGASHANMRYKVIALPPEDYKTFIEAAKAYTAPVPEPGTSEARGYDLFMNGKPETGAVACAACHRIQGTPAASPVGPDLSFFGTRRTLGAGMWEATTPEHWDAEEANAHLVAWIEDSPREKPGSLMPPYNGEPYKKNGKIVPAEEVGKLTPEEIQDIANYLKTLKLPEEADYWAQVNKFDAEQILPAKNVGGIQ